MEQKIVTSNNDYAKKVLKIAVAALVGSLAAFFVILAFFNDAKYTAILCFIIAAFIVALCLVVFAVSIQKVELTVTNKRVYGATKFGKRVDLPLDSVSSVGMSSFKGIAVGTSSGRIVFKGIGNRDEIYEVINKLIIERQDKASAEPVKQEAPASSLDEIKKAKELLDAGIITQEEFDAKKKQLLGL